jgi:hypothetical protein
MLVCLFIASQLSHANTQVDADPQQLSLLVCGQLDCELFASFKLQLIKQLVDSVFAPTHAHTNTVTLTDLHSDTQSLRTHIHSIIGSELMRVSASHMCVLARLFAHGAIDWEVLTKTKDANTKSLTRTDTSATAHTDTLTLTDTRTSTDTDTDTDTKVSGLSDCVLVPLTDSPHTDTHPQPGQAQYTHVLYLLLQKLKGQQLIQWLQLLHANTQRASTQRADTQSKDTQVNASTYDELAADKLAVLLSLCSTKYASNWITDTNFDVTTGVCAHMDAHTVECYCALVMQAFVELIHTRTYTLQRFLSLLASESFSSAAFLHAQKNHEDSAQSYSARHKQSRTQTNISKHTSRADGAILEFVDNLLFTCFQEQLLHEDLHAICVLVLACLRTHVGSVCVPVCVSARSMVWNEVKKHRLIHLLELSRETTAALDSSSTEHFYTALVGPNNGSVNNDNLRSNYMEYELMRGLLMVLSTLRSPEEDKLLRVSTVCMRQLANYLFVHSADSEHIAVAGKYQSKLLVEMIRGHIEADDTTGSFDSATVFVPDWLVADIFVVATKLVCGYDDGEPTAYGISERLLNADVSDGVRSGAQGPDSIRSLLVASRPHVFASSK